MFQFHNIEILNSHISKPFPSKSASIILSNLAKDYTEDQISVIFVDGNTIRKLNREFRQKDEETDVLSFEPAFQDISIGEGQQESDEKPLVTPIGEIYICPPYIMESLKAVKSVVSEERFIEEIYRMIIHGILHLAGREHSTSLDYDRIPEDIEPMFVEQEKLLSDFLSLLV